MEKQCHSEPEILNPIIPDLYVEIPINPRIICVLFSMSSVGMSGSNWNCSSSEIATRILEGVRQQRATRDQTNEVKDSNECTMLTFHVSEDNDLKEVVILIFMHDEMNLFRSISKTEIYLVDSFQQRSYSIHTNFRQYVCLSVRQVQGET